MKRDYRNSSIQQDTMMYVAYAKAILKNDETGMITSDVLGIFLVTPIIEKVTGKIVGFREARTQKKVIVSKQRIEYTEKGKVVLRDDCDIISRKNEAGGIKWDVFTNLDVSTSDLMGMKGMAEYFYKEDDMLDGLTYIRERAEGLAKDFQNKPCKETRKETQKRKIVNQRPTYIAKQA